jgi:ABC-2 type transport system ATP-binding protein
MIKISNLTVKYKKKKAVDNLSLTIKKGESILLAGPNGSGKTTLLQAAVGVLNTSMGSVFVDDRKVDHKTRKKTAYIPASISFYDSLKIKEAIKFHASFYPAFSYKKIASYEFDHTRKIGTLSKGEKTLFALSLALSTKPEYLFIDDVIHFLDPHLREIFLTSILQLIEDEQMTVVIAAQSSFDIEGILERVIVLDKGKVYIDEQVEKLKQKFVKIYSKTLRENLPVVFSRDWQGMKELFLYPYTPELKINEKVEYLTLPEIIRAFIGGGYDSH